LALLEVNASLFGVGNALDQTSTQFRLSPKQLAQAHQELVVIGIDPSRPYVALVVRDAHYFDKFGNTLSNGRMRNREVSDFVPSVLKLAALGVQVVRMGHLVASPLQVSHPLVFDYATSGRRSELLDIFLPLNATAVVSTLTGSDAVALVGRRPVLYVDIALYAQVFHATSRATWVPALLRDQATDRTLTLSEVFSLGAGWFVGPEQFESAGLEAVQSPPEDIACYVADFVQSVLAHGEYRGDTNLQQQGRAALAAAMGSDGRAMHGDVRSQILDGFLSRSPGFLL
jgi:putative glycosyltransferase (TIGR04372 family)